MINWPNPVIFSLGPISLHWYGLMYAITFLLAYFIMQNTRLGKALPLTSPQKDNLLVCLILGIILGGRLGYILFYNPAFYLANPLKIPAVWEGGLSFHGGVIGTIIAALLYMYFHNRRNHKKENHQPVKFLQITDIAVFVTPIGIMLGRIGNFINSELYGRISPSGNYCLNFPTDPANCRYPSQLFESASEGLFLLIVMYILSKKTTRPGILSGVFAILYGIIRIIMEFFREPDVQIGFIGTIPGLNTGITMGQLLSLGMILIGIIILIATCRKSQQNKAHTKIHTK